jgi:hypothetical protein
MIKLSRLFQKIIIKQHLILTSFKINTLKIDSLQTYFKQENQLTFYFLKAQTCKNL